MKSKRLRLLFCGRRVADNKELITLLKLKYEIIFLNDFKKLEKVITGKSINLIIFEFSQEDKTQLDILKKIKSKRPDVIVVVVNGSQSVQKAAEILAAGVADVFPVPYNADLLAERVNALLKMNN